MFRIIFNKCVEKYYVTFGIYRAEMEELKETVNWLKNTVDEIYPTSVGGGWEPLFKKLENHINMTKHIKTAEPVTVKFNNQKYSVKITHQIHGQQKRNLQYTIVFLCNEMYVGGGYIVAQRKRSPKKCSE